ncbi:MAG: protein-L-isoaspartate(D-aspartate) O-methyltransferase [Leptonema sp. (in: Bacteria)]|nr:protein-L-isoaspartate(D-aspartate) O-methyltransferase [Leptonema sp. (in: bacteria)]
MTREIHTTKMGPKNERPSYQKDKLQLMIQIRNRGIQNLNIEQALHRFPREWFVSEKQKPDAYNDNPLPIGSGQTISQPYIVALMTDLLDLTGSEKVLEIGTGCGYQTAILGSLCKEVHSIEIVKSLYKSTVKRFENFAKFDSVVMSQVFLYLKDGKLGVSEAAPFDRILCAAESSEIPPEWTKQLKVGGKIVMPLNNDLVVLTKTKESLDLPYTKKVIIPVRFVPLV